MNGLVKIGQWLWLFQFRLLVAVFIDCSNQSPAYFPIVKNIEFFIFQYECEDSTGFFGIILPHKKQVHKVVQIEHF